MSNFEMGFNNPLEENKNEEEKNNEITAEIFASLLKEVQDKKNLLNNEKFQEGLEEKEDPEINQEVIEEFKNKEEIELSSIEVKKPFTNKIRKTLLIMTAVLALSSTPAFAGLNIKSVYEEAQTLQRLENQRNDYELVKNFNIDKDAMVMTYTFNVDQNIPYTEYSENLALINNAHSDFCHCLKLIFELNNFPNWPNTNNIYEPGKIIVQMTIKNFIEINKAQLEYQGLI